MPRTSFLTLCRALVKRPQAPEGGIPASIETTFEAGPVNPAHLARYNAMFGFEPGSMPLTYYYLVAQRAHLATMVTKEFPFRILGMVHVENALVEHRPLQMRCRLRVVTSVRIEPPSESGARFCVFETVALDQGQQVFTCSSKYLAVRGQRKRGAGAQGEGGATGPAIARWRLAASAGREYASVSGDWNPIHLARWSARLLGMRSPIIHGMHSIGKACAVLQAAAGRPVVAISARFKAPVALGEAVDLSHGPGADTFVLSCAGRQAVEGRYGTA